MQNRGIGFLVLVVLLTMSLGGHASENTILESPANELASHNIQSYQQAPLLAKQVEKGELPPVEKRLPKDPYVVEPKEIGVYGGTARLVTLRPRVTHIDGRIMDFNAFLKPRPDGGGTLINFARKIEISPDTSEYTVFLRRGVKWSDGEPFTADDILFWYEDVLLNEDLTPAISSDWRVDGEIVKVEKLDDYTVKFIFVAPNPFFEMRLAHTWGEEPLLPSHYLKKYHIDYTPREDLLKMAKESGFEHWYELFLDRADRTGILPNQPDLPTLGPYKLVAKGAERNVFERNPYYWKIDSAGNQLPYLDRIEVTLASERGIIDGMLMSGALDYEGSATDIRSYPMYKQYEEQGNYRTLLWTSGMANEVIYMLNLTHEDPILREVFQDVRFRRALSLAINRQEINEVIYFGRAEPSQYTVLESSRYFEPEFAKAYAQYDPDRANQLLDEMGLDQRDGEGWRLRPDGKRLTFTIEFFDFETPKLPNIELVSSHWQEVGIDVRTRAISGELQEQRAPANMMDATVWHGDKASDILFPMGHNIIIPMAPGWDNGIWPLWAQWINTGGQSGEEPPPEVLQIRQWYDEAMSEPDEERRVELGKKILASQAENLWVIGTVGKAPWVLIVNKDLRNVPEEGLWVWDNLWSGSMNPSTFYFAQ